MADVPCERCAPLVARLRRHIRWLEGGEPKKPDDWRRARRTERDQEIIRLVRRGHTNAAIARLVGLTRGGVWHAVRRLGLR